MAVCTSLLLLHYRIIHSPCQKLLYWNYTGLTVALLGLSLDAVLLTLFDALVAMWYYSKRQTSSV